MNTLRIASRTLRAFTPLARSTGFDFMQVRTKVTSEMGVDEEQVVKKTATLASKKATLANTRAALNKNGSSEEERIEKKRDTKANALKEAVKERRAKNASEKKAKIASSGPVSAKTLFIKQQAGKGMSLKQMSEKFNTLGASEKQALVNQAQENLAKRNEIRKSLKKPATKYALFVKKNFAAAHEAAKRETDDKKEAFKLATKALAAKYKASQK